MNLPSIKSDERVISKCCRFGKEIRWAFGIGVACIKVLLAGEGWHVETIMISSHLIKEPLLEETIFTKYFIVFFPLCKILIRENPFPTFSFRDK